MRSKIKLDDRDGDGDSAIADNCEEDIDKFCSKLKLNDNLDEIFEHSREKIRQLEAKIASQDINESEAENYGNLSESPNKSKVQIYKSKYNKEIRCEENVEADLSTEPRRILATLERNKLIGDSRKELFSKKLELEESKSTIKALQMEINQIRECKAKLKNEMSNKERKFATRIGDLQNSKEHLEAVQQSLRKNIDDLQFQLKSANKMRGYLDKEKCRSSELSVRINELQLALDNNPSDYLKRLLEEEKNKTSRLKLKCDLLEKLLKNKESQINCMKSIKLFDFLHGLDASQNCLNQCPKPIRHICNQNHGETNKFINVDLILNLNSRLEENIIETEFCISQPIYFWIFFDIRV
ncbi:MAG: hypothetical protein MHMPM18_002519 [Marteilia pararefringens]